MIEVVLFNASLFNPLIDICLIQQGLLNEIIALREIESSHATLTTQNNKCSTQAENSTADYTTGIYQSIGASNCHRFFLAY